MLYMLLYSTFSADALIFTHGRFEVHLIQHTFIKVFDGTYGSS